MHKLILSLVASLFVSTVALAAGDASSATPPIANGAIPSGYVWLSGGAVAVGIGYTWDTVLFTSAKTKNSISSSFRAYRSWTSALRG
jgi:hypothetical protein